MNQWLQFIFAPTSRLSKNPSQSSGLGKSSEMSSVILSYLEFGPSDTSDVDEHRHGSKVSSKKDNIVIADWVTLKRIESITSS